MNRFRWGAAIAVIVLAAAATLPIAAESSDLTVGQFLVRLAQLKQINVSDPAVARSALNASGFPVPAGLELNDRLTEGDVVEISREAGVRLRTSNPSAPFTGEQADRFFLSLATEFGADVTSPVGLSNNGNGLGGTFDPFSKGKGKGKGKGNETPTDPE